MIQPQELRKGNKIIANGLHGGRIMTVDRLADKGTLSEKNRPVMFEEHEVGEFLKDCNPIPLTPSILSACGFTPLSDPEFTHHHPELNILFDGESFWLKEGTVTHYLSKCECLHKLQNGVFWVTGKELVVNIEKVKV